MLQLLFLSSKAVASHLIPLVLMSASLQQRALHNSVRHVECAHQRHAGGRHVQHLSGQHGGEQESLHEPGQEAQGKNSSQFFFVCFFFILLLKL